MAKTWNNLYPAICSLENLYAAAASARKRKTRLEAVERFELHRERFLGQLHDELVTETWQPSGYRQFYIHDPKTRLISAAPYRDRVVHHALCRIIGPLIERRFVADSFSCQRGKGTTAARDRCRRYTNRFRYVLKCDIGKFFQSIDHEILRQKLARIIRCRPTLALCDKIIASTEDCEQPPTWFPGDDLFTPVSRHRGLPIGNLTSQLWANLYLDRMDHWLKEVAGAPGYARYTDDFLIWNDDKGRLWALRERLSESLAADRLALHPVKTRVLACREGVPFLGFRFSPDRRPRLAGESKRRFEKRTRRQLTQWDGSEDTAEPLRRSMRGWTAFASYGNVKGLMQHYRDTGFG